MLGSSCKFVAEASRPTCSASTPEPGQRRAVHVGQLAFSGLVLFLALEGMVLTEGVIAGTAENSCCLGYAFPCALIVPVG